jgi:2-phosphoglycerate kinase
VSERRYLAPLPLGGEEGPPWSKGLLSRALAATGLGTTRAYDLARRVDADLAERETDRLDLDRLGELAAEVLGEAEGARTMRRLRRLHALRQLDAPIVLLVGGATGTGKSTIATEDAHLLGFLDQTRNVLVGVEAAIDRSLAEGWSMVLEGVHLVPGMVDVDRAGAIVVQCVIAIDDEDLHRSHFWVRDHATEGLRPLEKYIDGMPEIRRIQDALVERAQRFDVPVIHNSTLDQAMGEVLDLVLSTADRLVRA